MKTLFFSVLIIPFVLYSQWETNIRLTNDPAQSQTCMNNSYAVAASGDTIHVVWYDNRTGGYKIYYKRSVNGGLNWSSDTALSGGIASPRYPAIAVNGSKVHIAFDSYINQSTSNIWHKVSTNSGINWSTAESICDVTIPQFVRKPSIAVTGTNVHISWNRELTSGTSCINYMHSVDNGATWGTLFQLTVGNDKGIPAICASGNNVLIAFADNQYGENEITCTRSTNSGSYWSSSRLTNSPGNSYQPSISISGLNVIMVWIDYRTGDARLYQKRSDDAGATWLADGQLTTNTYIPYMPNIFMSGSYAHVVWYDSAYSQLFYLRGVNNGNSWQTRTQITESPSLPNSISVTASGNKVHAVWTDKRHGEGEIYYKRNPTGNSIGIIKLSSDIPVKFNLSQNYPNPFNPVTKIRFDIAPGSRPGVNNNTVLKIYDIMGREVTTLVNEQLQPGTYEAEWNGSNYSSGIYYYKLTAETYTDAKKMILIK